MSRVEKVAAEHAVFATRHDGSIACECDTVFTEWDDYTLHVVIESRRSTSAEWIEWVQNLTGQYVTTVQDARRVAEELVAGYLQYTLDASNLRADAWDEGYAAGTDDEFANNNRNTERPDPTPNPYRGGVA